MLKRYNYWYTDNYQTPQCPSGMDESPNGTYVRYSDIKAIIDRLERLDALAKRLGYASAETCMALHCPDAVPDPLPEIEHTGD